MVIASGNSVVPIRQLIAWANSDKFTSRHIVKWRQNENLIDYGYSTG